MTSVLRWVDFALIVAFCPQPAFAEPALQPSHNPLFGKISVGGIEIALGKTSLKELREAFGKTASINQIAGASQLCYTQGKFLVWFAATGHEGNPISAIGLEKANEGELPQCGVSRLPLENIGFNAPTIGDSVADIDAKFGFVRPDEHGNIRVTRIISTPAGNIVQTLVYALANGRVVGVAMMHSVS